MRSTPTYTAAPPQLPPPYVPLKVTYNLNEATFCDPIGGSVEHTGKSIRDWPA